MPYFERDEARRVGLGMQTLPEQINQMPAVESARMALMRLVLPCCAR